jgi:hypothetical protein
MGYRGRLIWPFAVTIARLNTSATASNTGGGAVTSGFDHDFREPQVLDGGDGAEDTSTRTETLIELLPCQIHTAKGQFEQMTQMLSGAVFKYNLPLVFHYIDLETRGLVEDDGSPIIKPNDRLVALYRNDGTLIRRFDNPELFAAQVQDRSWGLSGLQRNLLMINFKERETSSLNV